MSKILIALLCLTFISCATTRPEGKTEAEVLYKEALELKTDGRYLLAVEKLGAIRSQYPYSYYATHAELLNADILFEQDNFAEAAAAYIVFKDFHPKHAKMAYVTWKIAEAFYNQLPDTFDRDLSSGLEAIKYYRELLRTYGGSDFIHDAKIKIAHCELMIQKKEKYIADFYFKTEVFDSARFRYLKILDEFRDQDLRDHSSVRVLQATKELNQPSDCKKYYKKYKGYVSKKGRALFKEAYKDCQS